MAPATTTFPSLFDTLHPAQRNVLQRLASAFVEAGEELALVGGIVRDMLLARPLLNELDFATSATPDVTRRLGEAAGATSVFDIGERFGTIGLVFKLDSAPEPVVTEITTYRSEHYPDASRHPAVRLGGSLTDDLSRRDFTINAIAANVLSGELVDPFDGQADLFQNRIRAVGDPAVRFREDPLRLLRAARFVAQLGFSVAPETKVAMARQAHSLSRISKERILAELTKLLTGDYPSHGLDLLLDTGLLVAAMPELTRFADEALGEQPLPHREKALWEHTMRVVDQVPRRPALRWAGLLHDAAKPQTRSVDAQGDVHFFGHERAGAELAGRLLGRLKADKATRANVARIVEMHLRPATYEPDWTDSAVRRLMLEAGDVLEDLLDQIAADVTSAREHKQRAAARRIELLRAHIRRLEEERALAEFKSPLDGDDLMRLFSRPPGRWIATIKDHLRELVLDGELAPEDKEKAEEIARGMIERGEA